MANGKKIAFISAVPYGSTGKIINGISEVAIGKGCETLIYYGWTKGLRKSPSENVMVGSFADKCIHMTLAKLTGLNGCFSVVDTFRLIRRLKKFRPDVINLHLLHNWNLNLPMLFSYIKKHNIPVVWTMHDCWAFTGQCPHFIMANCDRWRTGCHNCSQYRQYPSSYVDMTKLMWKLKKKWFSGISNMTIVTPSEWLADLVRQSYLSEYPVKVINNGIDLSIFHPTESDFRERFHCENKHILLGVAFDWGKRKGLDVFVELSKRLPCEYQIVLVGTDDTIDEQLPENIISIHRTQSQQELAAIYSAADLFLNPTREDTYPTVNMEAIACGTPVITFKTGGSPEIIGENCGAVINCDDIDKFGNEIRKISGNVKEFIDICLSRARHFDMNERFNEYLEIFLE